MNFQKLFSIPCTVIELSSEISQFSLGCLGVRFMRSEWGMSPEFWEAHNAIMGFSFSNHNNILRVQKSMPFSALEIPLSGMGMQIQIASGWEKSHQGAVGDCILMMNKTMMEWKYIIAKYFVKEDWKLQWKERQTLSSRRCCLLFLWYSSSLVYSSNIYKLF